MGRELDPKDVLTDLDSDDFPAVIQNPEGSGRMQRLRDAGFELIGWPASRNQSTS
jgi:hypothetical protein